MGNSISNVKAETVSNEQMTPNKTSKNKQIVFVIVMIAGIGSLVVAGVGLGFGSHFGQVNSIILIAVGSSVGSGLLIVGIVGLVKNSSYCRQAKQLVLEESEMNDIEAAVKERIKKMEITPQHEHYEWLYSGLKEVYIDVALMKIDELEKGKQSGEIEVSEKIKTRLENFMNVAEQKFGRKLENKLEN